jgi:cytochrome c-type biogenesis protein
MDFSLIIPAFIAGVLTFLAPCTLPLVPAYLGFISGTSAKDLEDRSKSGKIRRLVIMNGAMYVLGFSTIFIFMGLVFGVGGSAILQYRDVLTKVGGGFIVFFGLYLMHFFDRFKFFKNYFEKERKINVVSKLKPGSPFSSLIFGATFAFGWTPCVGPILASILFLASSTATVWQGGLLLAVFSLGLGLPFMLLAVGIGHASYAVRKLSKILPYISFIGGVFLLILGTLLVTGYISVWLEWSYGLFKFMQFDGLLDYL